MSTSASIPAPPDASNASTNIPTNTANPAKTIVSNTSIESARQLLGPRHLAIPPPSHNPKCGSGSHLKSACGSNSTLHEILEQHRAQIGDWRCNHNKAKENQAGEVNEHMDKDKQEEEDEDDEVEEAVTDSESEDEDDDEEEDGEDTKHSWGHTCLAIMNLGNGRPTAFHLSATHPR